MRYYISEGQYAGQRLQVGHPLWPKTKAGTPYKKQPPRARSPDLYKILVPSVTTITALVEPFNGKNWIMSLIKKCPELDVHGWVEEESTRQRDLGTACHAAVEDFINTGEYPVDATLYKAVCAMEPHLEGETIHSEEQFANDMYGGTVDVRIEDYGCTTVKDFKFTSAARKCNAGEVVQMCLYMHHYKADVGVILPCHTDDMTVRPHRIVEGSEEYLHGLMAGSLARELFNETIRLKESMK